MNFSLDEIYGMTLDQVFLFTEATNKHLAERFRLDVSACAWGSRGDPEELKEMLKE